MRIALKILKYTSSGFFILLILLLVLVNSCAMFNHSDKKVLAKASKKEVKVTIHNYDCGDQPIRYMVYEHPTEKVDSMAVVCLHGSPGKYSDYSDQFYDTNLLKQTDFIVIERPGYGGSSYGQPEISILKQARCIEQIMEKENRPNYILSGYSYGGPVVGTLGGFQLEEVRSLIMVAPVIDPDNEKYFWFSRLPAKKGFRWMLPKALYSATLEKVSHPDALAEIKPYWAKIQVPTYHIHGKKDNIAPFVNTEFGKAQVDPKLYEVLEVPKGTHAILWQEKDLLKQTIQRALDASN